MNETTSSIYGFSKLAFNLVLCAHWIACLFFGISYKISINRIDTWLVVENLIDAPISV